MAATTDRDRCPPAPPQDITVELQTEPLAPGPDDLVRLHWRGNPALGFSIAKRGNRFDPLGSPWESTRVLYAGTTLEVAIAETILRWHGQVKGPVELSNQTQLRDRQVARFRPSRQLTVINATGLGLNPIQRAVDQTVALPPHASAWASGPAPLADDIFQCPASEYATTQAWGAWFRSQCPDADAIQWVSRQFNLGRSLVLFEDRCGRELIPTGHSVDLLAPGRIEEQTLDRLLAQIGWTRG